MNKVLLILQYNIDILYTSGGSSTWPHWKCQAKSLKSNFNQLKMNQLSNMTQWSILKQRWEVLSVVWVTWLSTTWPQRSCGKWSPLHLWRNLLSCRIQFIRQSTSWTSALTWTWSAIFPATEQVPTQLRKLAVSLPWGNCCASGYCIFL